MENATTMNPTAVHLVPSLPPSDPAAMDIEMNTGEPHSNPPVPIAEGSMVDVDMIDDTPRRDETHRHGTSETSSATTPMVIETATIVTESGGQPSPSVATENHSTNADTQTDVDTVDDTNLTDCRCLVVEELQPSSLPIDSNSKYTTSPAVKEGTLEGTDPTSHASSEHVSSNAKLGDEATPTPTAIPKNTETTPIPTSIESAVVKPATLSDQIEEAAADVTTTSKDIKTTAAPTYIKPDIIESASANSTYARTAATEPASAEPASAEPASSVSHSIGTLSTEPATVETTANKDIVPESEIAEHTEFDASRASKTETEDGSRVPESSSKYVNPHDSAAQDTHMHDASNHEDNALAPTSPPDLSVMPAAIAMQTEQPKNTEFEVHRLQADYDSSCDSISQFSDRETETEAENKTVAGVQESSASSNTANDDIEVTEPIENSQVLPTTVAPGGDAEPVEPTPVRTSLFGGPKGPLNTLVTASDGPESSVSAEAETGSKIGIITDVDPAAETGPTACDGLSTEDAEFLSATNDPPGPPFFGTPDLSPVEDVFDWDTKHDAKSGAELDTVAGTEFEFLDVPPKTDEDAKPDLKDFSSNTSQASRNVAYMELINNRFEDVPLPQDGDILEESDNVPDMFKTKPIRNKTPECMCGECRVCKWGLRPKANDGYVAYPNHVPDTDNSENYEPRPDSSTKRQRVYKSKKKIVDVDMEDDEEDEQDEEDDEDVTMSGVSIDMFNSTLPYNQNDAFIGAKNLQDEESASDGEIFNTKGKKRAKARSSKAHKSTKKVKKNAKVDEVDEGPQTIAGILQRLAKAVTTKLSYPMTFNSNTSCNICSTSNFAILGFCIRKIKIYDFGKGNGAQEIPNTDAASRAVSTKQKIDPTTLCMGCTTSRMQILMCKQHTLAPLDPLPTMDVAAAFERLKTDRPPAEDDVWCSICPSPALYSCRAATVLGAKGCGLKLCETCAVKLSATHDGDLGAMLTYLHDEVTDEYKGGLRADAELLRENGELMKYMIRESKERGKEAA